MMTSTTTENITNEIINEEDFKIKHAVIYQNVLKDITAIHGDSLFDDYEENYTYYNMLNTNELKPQAIKVIKAQKGKVLFAHETYSWGDCDEMGPTEHFWKLYLVVRNKDNTNSNIMYSREVFELREKDKDVPYEFEDYFINAGDVFANIKPEELEEEPEDEELEEEENYGDYEEYREVVHDVIHNIDPAELSKPGQEMLKKVCESLRDNEKVSFIGEVEDLDDKTEPLEHFWHLYIFISRDDGKLIKRQFYREFDWLFDADIEGLMDGVPYYEREFIEEYMKGVVFQQ